MWLGEARLGNALGERFSAERAEPRLRRHPGGDIRTPPVHRLCTPGVAVVWRLCADSDLCKFGLPSTYCGHGRCYAAFRSSHSLQLHLRSAFDRPLCGLSCRSNYACGCPVSSPKLRFCVDRIEHETGRSKRLETSKPEFQFKHGISECIRRHSRSSYSCSRSLTAPDREICSSLPMVRGSGSAQPFLRMPDTTSRLGSSRQPSALDFWRPLSVFRNYSRSSKSPVRSMFFGSHGKC